MRAAGETPFAVITLCLTVPYFLGETYSYFTYVEFGKYFLGYFVDLIAMALMLLASVTSLRVRPNSAAGWFAAAWGFAACLNLRSFSWRYYEVQENGALETEPTAILYVLGALLVLSFGALIYSLFLSRPSR